MATKDLKDPFDASEPDVVAETKPRKSSPMSESAMVKENVYSTKRSLDAQPKVSIRINKKSDPKAPNFETVCINGYVYQIQVGVPVDVPEAVAFYLE